MYRRAYVNTYDGKDVRWHRNGLLGQIRSISYLAFIYFRERILKKWLKGIFCYQSLLHWKLSLLLCWKLLAGLLSWCPVSHSLLGWAHASIFSPSRWCFSLSALHMLFGLAGTALTELVAVVIWHEQLDLTTGLGILLIIAGVILLNIRSITNWVWKHHYAKNISKIELWLRFQAMCEDIAHSFFLVVKQVFGAGILNIFKICLRGGACYRRGHFPICSG